MERDRYLETDALPTRTKIHINSQKYSVFINRCREEMKESVRINGGESMGVRPHC